MNTIPWLQPLNPIRRLPGWSEWQVPARLAALHLHRGEVVGELATGRHRFVGLHHQLWAADRREQQLLVVQQELLTADGLPVRLSVLARFRITDVRRLFEAQVDAEEAFRAVIQLALRELVTELTLDQLLEQRGSLGQPLTLAVAAAIGDRGIEVLAVDPRDLTLGAEVRQAHAAVALARKTALAELERARGQAAATRTLVNAARLLESHPGLAQLRQLEAFDQLARNSGHHHLLMHLPEAWMTAGL